VRRVILALVATALFAVLAPMFGDFWLFVFTLGVIYALTSLGLVVVTGWSGQLNLHVAALGLGWGAYSAYGLVSLGVPVVWALLGAGLLAAPFAVVVAVAAVRFRGLELAVATLALGLIFERLFFRNLGKLLTSRTTSTPFESSFVPIGRPRIFGVELDGDLAFFRFTLIVAVVLFVVTLVLSRGSTGRILRAVRTGEVRAETLGIPVVGYRIAAFTWSVVLASTAGALLASLKLGIAPDSFNLDLSFQILAAAVIGGIRSPAGAVTGGALAALLPELVRSGPLSVFGGERLFLLFGAGMILVLWRMPNGLAGLPSLVRRLRNTTQSEEATPSTLGAAGLLADVPVLRRLYGGRVDRERRPTLLRVEGLRVSFGGVHALDGASLAVPEGEICALIGPNGAGKSTLFNCVSGLITPDEGRLYLRGRDVTDAPAHRRAALGVGRTFQTAQAFNDLSVLENVMVGAHRYGTDAREILATLGLTGVAQKRPGDLPLPTLRALEIAMVLAARPALLLLDEPSAGLDRDETAALADLVARVRETAGVGVILVEHDMALVERLAEHVFVLDFGRIIAHGTPEEVRSDPVVIERYLGELAAGASRSKGRVRARAR
jgi:ABC-type branched-subunit amino acid transport system ATPase component/ABC-type branched-subunit amino acid transport system permease subunit